jgi:glycosyltransferase involved in cell wall biosynthesis
MGRGRTGDGITVVAQVAAARDRLPARMSERAKEVLYIWPYLEWGGAQIYFAGLMKFAREKYAVRAVMPEGSAARLLSYMERLEVPCDFFGAHWDVSPAPSLKLKLRRRWRKAYTEFVLARHLSRKDLRQSILHVDAGPWQSFWLLLYLSLRSDVFVTMHTALPAMSWPRRMEWKLKFMLLNSLRSFHLLASNRDMLKSLVPYLPEKSLSPIRIAYSGIDRDEITKALEADFERARLCEKFSLARNDFLVFGMGQFIERKGCWVLLEAAKHLLDEDDAISFVWLGTGALSDEDQHRIEAYGLGQSFRVITPAEIGPQRADLLQLLRLADMFVLPSFNEGLPIALLEAMALGKACVASRINAVPEAVTDHETGILVEAGDHLALAAAIRELKANTLLRERIALAGQNFVLENFDERDTARITVDCYDACSRAS